MIGIADPLRPSAAAEAIRAGVFDVLPRPPSSRDLEALLANAREQAALAASPQHTRTSEQMPFGVIGASPAMRAVMDLVQRAASGRCGMLILRRTWHGSRDDRARDSRARHERVRPLHQGGLLEPGTRGSRAAAVRDGQQAAVRRRSGTTQPRADRSAQPSDRCGGWHPVSQECRRAAGARPGATGSNPERSRSVS